MVNKDLNEIETRKNVDEISIDNNTEDFDRGELIEEIDVTSFSVRIEEDIDNAK